MNGYPFDFFGAALVALPSGALWWPERGVLCAADLHLGKSERIARRGGGLLPPYETEETLARLADDLGTTDARVAILLGDSFDDLAAAGNLSDPARNCLSALQAGRHWFWVEGNHDPGPVSLGGSHRADLRLGPLHFRHQAEPAARGEVSGHFHPKLRIARSSRRVFLVDGARLILPAYGAYTGGLRCDDAALAALMQPGALAILTGPQMAAVPMPRAEQVQA